MTEVFPHLYLPGPTETHPFTAPRSGGDRSKNPVRNRADHAIALQRKLEAAWLAADNARNVSQAVRSGVYVEFASEPGYQLVFQSLENIRSGIRLLNVRRGVVRGKEETLATVFVPNDKRSLLLRKIEAYASEQTRTGSPKNAKLVESISDIRSAVVRSFWTDDAVRIPGGQPEWIELWVRVDSVDTMASVKSLLGELAIERRDEVLEFPERAVCLVRASQLQLAQLIEQADWVAELRAAVPVAGRVLQLSNRDQTGLVERVLARCSFSEHPDVSVCVLDTGVNSGHALLQPVVNDSDRHAVREQWGKEDHAGHGTLMAGTVAYGDLLDAVTGERPLTIEHAVESVKILPPPPQRNPKELWGAFTIQAISRAEIQAPGRRRVVCMAVTAPEDRREGRPTAWSGAVDGLASGYIDDERRLVVLFAGNADLQPGYPEVNLTDEVHEPAQAWNALTVGAYTNKTIIEDPRYEGHQAVAPTGCLSPFSTCSCTWSSTKWPIKPEVLFEGGNAAQGPDGTVSECEDLSSISTYKDPQVAQFAPFGMTSAASALAAHMAARLRVLYPDAWPETVRAAIVHSAEWTHGMKQQFPAANKRGFATRVRACGYGVPDFNRAAYCMRDSLTLVAQAEIQPFEMRNGVAASNEMHFYRLPWPADVLADLGETPVEMRVTLSYFVEPSPGEIGWRDRYRYASHGLRFEVNGPGEPEDEFKQRINRQARQDEERPDTSGPGSRWTLGVARNVGSIHSDIWEGTAVDLSASNLLGEPPRVQWRLSCLSLSSASVSAA
jgi:hypothetical protein